MEEQLSECLVFSAFAREARRCSASSSSCSVAELLLLSHAIHINEPIKGVLTKTENNDRSSTMSASNGWLNAIALLAIRLDMYYELRMVRSVIGMTA